jgi:hypothetical protein
MPVACCNHAEHQEDMIRLVRSVGDKASLAALRAAAIEYDPFTQ